jgi:hypothetical protein
MHLRGLFTIWSVLRCKIGKLYRILTSVYLLRCILVTSYTQKLHQVTVMAPILGIPTFLFSRGGSFGHPRRIALHEAMLFPGVMAKRYYSCYVMVLE